MGRVNDAKLLKNKKIKMRKQGKLSSEQISRDRHGINSKLTQFINTGRGPDMHIMRQYKARSGGTLFRTRTGEIFVARDKMEEFIISGMRAKKYTEEEIRALGSPGPDGWRRTENVPLADVRRKLDTLAGSEDITKWLHFIVRKEERTHLALFFSPQKDRWFYLELNPVTGEARRSTIMLSKATAEFKRKRRILTWVPLTNPDQPIVI